MTRSPRNKGSFIVFIGPDGSGKTTVIERLASALTELGFRREQIHLVHWRPAWLPHLGELFGKELESDPAYTSFTPHKAPPSRFLGSLIRLLYYTIDFTIGFHVKIRPSLMNGDIVIFDRYYYDFVVDPRRSRIRLPEVIPKTLMRIVPQPHAVFFLDNKAEYLFARKPELPMKELERQLAKYRESLPAIKNSVLLPPGCPVEETVNRVVRLIVTKTIGSAEG